MVPKPSEVITTFANWQIQILKAAVAIRHDIVVEVLAIADVVDFLV